VVVQDLIRPSTAYGDVSRSGEPSRTLQKLQPLAPWSSSSIPENVVYFTRLVISWSEVS
jgi:hypothetical protein